jgi:hypothetical protein
MNTAQLPYLIVTIATLVFSIILLVFVKDAGTHEYAVGLASLAVGHWLGYVNQPTPLTATLQGGDDQSTAKIEAVPTTK